MYDMLQIPEVFFTMPKKLYFILQHRETQTLRPQRVRALKRIFILCDHDKDGALSVAELNDFQVFEALNSASNYLWNDL